MIREVFSAVQKLALIRGDVGRIMVQLAVAWVLQNDNVAAAIVGATRPEQVIENAKASGVRPPDEIMKMIDEVVGNVVERDPGETAKQIPDQRAVQNSLGGHQPVW